MTTEQAAELILILSALVSPVLHLAGLAAAPWARALLSLLPDIIGAIRRAQGKAGAPASPNVCDEVQR